MAAPTPLVHEIEEYVERYMKQYDPSHDFLHVDRVRRSALRIAQLEGVSAPADLTVLELAALMHDIGDHKYCSQEEADLRFSVLQEMMGKHQLPETSIHRIFFIIKNMGFSKEKELGLTNTVADQLLAIVQDADRLDAIGAIGIGRTFSYGGRRGTPMHDPSISTVGSTTLQHFDEKLLLLKDLMKTETGRKEASHRHNFLSLFKQQFLAEWSSEF